MQIQRVSPRDSRRHPIEGHLCIVKVHHSLNTKKPPIIDQELTSLQNCLPIHHTRR